MLKKVFASFLVLMFTVILLGTFQNAVKAESKVATNTGLYHTVVLKNDGTVWSWGYNSNGQLGDGTTTNQTSPVQVLNLTDIKAISTSDYFSLALKSDGTVWAWGYNYYGQLGDNSSQNYRSTPVQVLGLNNVIAISAGLYHSLALKSDGTVWAWGYNYYGQLGNGTYSQSLVPVQVSQATGCVGIKAIAAGGYFSAAIKYDGTVWTWGSNSYYQLGNSNTSPQPNPVQVGGLSGVTSIGAGYAHCLALKFDGAVVAWGYGYYGQLGNNSTSNSYTPVSVQLPANTNCEKIVSGKYCGYAIAADGNIYGWGMNTYGQLGNGAYGGNQLLPIQFKNMKNVVSISGLYSHSVAVKYDGTLRSCGENSYSKLGISGGTQYLPVFPTCIKLGFTRQPAICGGGSHLSAEGAFSLALKLDGTVKAWGYNGYGNLGDNTYNERRTPVSVPNLSDMVGISAGKYHSVALKNDGTVWTWGYNICGQLGTGSYNDRITPGIVPGLRDVIAVSARCYHTLALKSDGTVWAWGYNHKGQLGDGSQISRTSPVQVSGLTGIVAISAGSWSSYALKYDGSVWAWGYNAGGELGDGTFSDRLQPVQSQLSGVVAISAGDDHCLALKDNGTVCTWGANGWGQLGTGNYNNSNIPVQLSLSGVMAISAYQNISFTIKSDRTVWAWGQNDLGQLGDGTYSSHNSPAQVPSLTNFDLIGAGPNHAFAYKSDDGSVRGWGLNNTGQIGDNTITTRNLPVRVLNLNLGRKAIPMVNAAQYNSLTLKRNGIMRAWGKNNWGQLGCGYYGDRSKRVEVFWNKPDSIVDIATNGTFSMALTFDGLVYTWGLNYYGELGIGNFNGDRFNPQCVNGLTNVIDIAAVSESALALKEDGTVWAWGNNDYGQLGDGTFTNRSIPVQVRNLTDVVAIGEGRGHCLAIKSDGTVWAWGSNDYGQCGDNTTDYYKTTPVRVLNIANAVAVAGGNNHSLALLSNGTVWAWGGNSDGQIGDGTYLNRPTPVQVGGSLSNVKSIDTGSFHSLALLSDGTVKSWGDNSHYQLGDNTSNDRTLPVSALNLNNAIAVSASLWHSLAVKSDGTVWAWGDNYYGQLGDGTTSSRPAPTNSVEVNLKITADLGGTAVNIFSDNFDDGNANGWTIYGGTWSVTSGQYYVNSGAGYKSVANGTYYSDLIYEADVRVGSTSGDAGLIFRVSNPMDGMYYLNGYYVGISAYSDYVVLGKLSNNWTQLSSASVTIEPYSTYHLKVIACGSSIKVYVNDMVTPKINVTDSTHISGMIGVRTSNTEAWFDNIVVTPYLYNDSMNNQSLPGKIEAENYSAMYGIQTEYTEDVGGGKYVGWINTGDWMDYNVNVRNAGTYTVEYRVASPSGGQLQLKLADGTILATTTVPATGWWETWQTATATVTLPAGPQTLKIYASVGEWNFNWFKIDEPNINIPGKIEAENYLSMSGVQTTDSGDTGGGLLVGWIETGDWMDYIVNVQTAGTYTVQYRLASPNPNGQIQLKNADGTVLATTTVPNTGGWQAWQTASVSVTLAAGSQILRVYASSGGWNINWLSF